MPDSNNSVFSRLLKRPKRQIDEPVKPFLRGAFHQYGFYIALVLGIIVLTLATDRKARISFAIYFGSVLLVYGVSSTYHLTDWKNERAESLMQKLDHACIFFLIAGTYTPVCVVCLPYPETWVLNILKIVWSFALLGAFKSILFTNIPKSINVLFYLTLGFCILPFIRRVYESASGPFTMSFLSGGIIYALGGIVYGIEYPDPFPEIFGYHEVFHLCTVIANLCFAVPITIKVLFPL